MLYDENLLISEQQNIENCYQQIGLRYYAYHKENPAPEFADLVAAITASKMRMDQHRAEVLRANGMRLCPHCRQQTKIGSMYCNYCGLKIGEPVVAPAVPAAAAPVYTPPVAEVAEEIPSVPEVAEPEVTVPEVAEPEVTVPEVAEPEPTVPEPTVPEVAEPEVAEPEVAEPEVAEPEVTEPWAPEPVVEAAPIPTKPYERERDAVDPQRTMAASDEDVAAYAAQAEALRGTAEPRRCTCGAPIMPDSRFCMECGKRIADLAETPETPEAPAAKRFCSECGAAVTDPEARFCNNCGTPLADDGAAATKTCPNCGFTTTDPEVLFCIECGTGLL